MFLSKAQREALAQKEKAEEEEAARRKCVAPRCARMHLVAHCMLTRRRRRSAQASEHSSREWARSARAAEERAREEARRKRDAEREHEKQLEEIKLQARARSALTRLHTRSDAHHSPYWLPYPMCAVSGQA